MPPSIREILLCSTGLTQALESLLGDSLEAYELPTHANHPTPLSERFYRRRVVLKTSRSQRSVALCQLRVNRQTVSRDLIETVQNARTPFGTILRQRGIAFCSVPVRGVEAIVSDDLSCVTEMAAGSRLCGRISRIISAEGIVLAQTWEWILFGERLSTLTRSDWPFDERIKGEGGR